MTGKERFFSVLERKPVDRVPVMPYLSNWAAHLAGCKLNEYHTSGKKMAEASLKALRIHGFDLVNPQSDGNYIAEAMGVETKFMEDALPAVLSRPVKTLDDVTKLHVPDPYTEGRMPVYLEAIERLVDAVGDEVVVRAPGTGQFSLAGHLFGIENLIREICIAEAEDDDEAREKIHALLEICAQALIAFDTACIKKGASLILDGDSLASLNVLSPSIYRKYCYPYEKKVFTALNELKKDYKFATMLHCCGKNNLIADEMMQTGCDIIEFDYLCDLELYKKLSLKNHVCLMGNLNPAGQVFIGTPQGVYDEATAVLNVAAQDNFFMLGTGCEVAVDAPLENMKAMLAAAEDFAARKGK